MTTPMGIVAVLGTAAATTATPPGSRLSIAAT